MNPTFRQTLSLSAEGRARQRTLWLGVTLCAVLVALAGIFYLERMATLDMAFQSFHILRTGRLQIQSGRFGAAGTQVFPWLAQAIGLPLKGVMKVYSIGHALYFSILFLVCILGFRQWRWGLVMILLATLMSTHTFYWLSEMPQGLAFLAVLLAWVHKERNSGRFNAMVYVVVAAAAVTAFYFHPLILHAFFFCAVYFWLDSHTSPEVKRPHMLLAGIFSACFVLKYFVLPLDWYDAMSLERAKAFAELWPNWFSLKSQRDFLRWLAADYYLMAAVIGLNVAYFLFRRHWVLGAWCAAAPTGFVFLVNVPHHYGAHQFYMENLYLPLALMAAVPLVFGMLSEVVRPSRMWIVVAVLAAAGVVRIVQAHRPWTARVRWEQDFLTKTEALSHRKWILAETQVPMDTLLMSWGSAFEFLMLSALKNPDSSRCIIIDETPERFDSLRRRPNLFLGEFKNYPFEALPERYFRIRDTSEYRYWTGR
jgi:hypothetical protein